MEWLLDVKVVNLRQVYQERNKFQNGKNEPPLVRIVCMCLSVCVCVYMYIYVSV